jgi:hypothetical protein
MEATTMSVNGWADIIASYNNKICEKPENGFFTRSQWEEKWNKGTTDTGRMISKLVKAKMMEVKKFKIIMPTRGLYPTPHYKLIKK